MATRREILRKARSYCAACDPGRRRQYQADPLSSSPDGTVAPVQERPTMSYGARRFYDVGVLGFKESMPFTARGTATAPVKPKQPKNQRDFLKDEPHTPLDNRRTEYESGVNPWAVCHASVGAAKSTKFERCVRDIKSKNKIKGD